MPSPPRFLPPGYPVFVTARTQEGLPFTCSRYMSLIITSALARAHSLFPVPLCAFQFMGNHFHLLTVTSEPELLVRFIDHLKTELAHAVNRLLGRRRHSVWCEGFDAQPILTRQDTINKLVYLYTNPQKAALVDHIELFPGVSSWNLFVQDSPTLSSPWVRRPHIKQLSSRSLSQAEDVRFTQELRQQAEQSHSLTLQPFAWIHCFAPSPNDSTSTSQVKDEIIQLVREREQSLRQERTRPCLGAERLRRQPLDAQYTPSKYSRRMWCICADVPLRKAFINWTKGLIRQGREVLRRWRSGDRRAAYPPGLFPPTFPKLANLVPTVAFQRI